MDVEMNEEEFSVERAFGETEVPCWGEQLTVRSLVVSFLLSILFNFIVMKLNLANGIIPSVSVSAGLLGFFMVKTWTRILHKTGFLKVPFTRQENVVIQTCVVASSSITFSGGLGSYLFGMSRRIVNQSGGEYLKDVKEPELLWMVIFLFLVSFTGLFAVVSLRKIMIMDLNLTYPSGTATAHLINTFHTPQGGKLARKQVKKLGQCFSASFLWGLFKWFFKGGHGCGFDHFPIFGLQAYHNRFYFDFSTIYIGIGMISPFIVNISMLIGGILSWGIMWPLIERKKGVWFAADLPSSSMRGLQGYKVFISDSMILGHGIYNFCKVLYTMMIQLRHKSNGDSEPSSFDGQRRALYFLKDEIPIWVACLGYVCLCTFATILLPQIFGQLKFYYIIIIYIMGPILAFCNAYGCGLTDWNLCSTYGKIAIFIVGAWGGSHQGVVVCLAACGVMMSLVSTASDLIQNFKICYLTLASPRSIFVSQVIGTAMGCITSALVFKLFYSAFPDLGLQNSEYPAPYATIFFSMATLGVEGFQALPTNCLSLCGVFFAGSILINAIKDYNSNKKWSRWIPVPMAMAIPFFIGSYFAIDMCLGSLILIVWQKLNRAESEMYAPAVASGMICGEGIWSLPSVVLALAGIKPPMCMKFLPRSNK